MQIKDSERDGKKNEYGWKLENNKMLRRGLFDCTKYFDLFGRTITAFSTTKVAATFSIRAAATATSSRSSRYVQFLSPLLIVLSSIMCVCNWVWLFPVAVIYRADLMERHNRNVDKQITRVLFCGPLFPASHEYTIEYLQKHSFVKVPL